MYIKCWGARGSIPVSGKDYIKYGGDTTCLEIRAKNGDIIIVDAGSGIRRLGNQLLKEKKYKYNFVFTHAHWDHVLGFPFFKPIYSEKFEFKMYRCPFSGYVKKMLSKVMDPPSFPIKYSDLRATMIYEESCAKEFEIGSIQVVPIALSHPNTGSGYKFIENNKIFVFLTDNELGFVHKGGLPYEAYVDFCKDADFLIHDSEYTTEEYKKKLEWGHSTYKDALRLAKDAKVKIFGLFHHNQERTDDELDNIVKDCEKEIIEKKLNIKCFGISTDMVFEL